ncbi:MAG: hypothetical protein JNK82_12405 [Myxococcaceae bacterium]|nr:hypothetical protein [Myxococcaceae bacterium]
MYRSFYENLSFAWLPTATLVFFLTVFALALVKLFVLNGRRDFEHVAALPLEKENPS